MYRILIIPHNQTIEVNHGENLLKILRQWGYRPDAPCGGTGKCGKCKVLIDGVPALACQTAVNRSMTVSISTGSETRILTAGIHATNTVQPQEGYSVALDIGTTTVAGFLLDNANGNEFATASRLNPQVTFGADVVSRIQAALKGELPRLTNSIRKCTADIITELCEKANISPYQISKICPVGNPAMQQIFLGLSPENLARIPFRPILTEAKAVSAKEHLPLCENASLLIVPDIAGFIGADTVAGVLATAMDQREDITLLVDIGTNGEIVLGNRHRLIACSTAAGPALEGAAIQCGMRGQTGAIDHVWLENRSVKHSVIGGGEAIGICGSGLIDAIAVFLELGQLNSRGRILNESRSLTLTDKVFLTQEDIRQLQTAKGAIAAGIELMVKEMGIGFDDINQVYLAGAFGTYMNPKSACRIGLLPPALSEKITAAGNTAGSGAKQLLLDTDALDRSQTLVHRIGHLELASHPDFRRTFANNMRL